METMKKMLLLPLFFMMISILSAQNNDAVVAAFENSHELEGKGEYADAVDALKEVYDESSYMINARLGWLAYMTGNFAESMAYYERAIYLKPYALEPRFGLVLPESAMGNWTSVMNQYEKILEIDPLNTTALYRLGVIYYGKEDYEKASKYFEKVSNLYPFDYDSIVMFAWSQFKMGKLKEARVLFSNALLIKPDNESAQEGLELIDF